MHDSVERVSSVPFGNDSVLTVAENKDYTEERFSSWDPWSCTLLALPVTEVVTENGNLRE